MHIVRTLTILGILASANFAFGQKDIMIPINQRVILTYPEYTVYANVLTVENRIKPNDLLYYHWFSSNDIKKTRGGFEGKLLHGTYTEFYLNKNLKEKGAFRYGLQDGEWKSWYISGEYKEINNWKRGKRQGRYCAFDEKGKLVEAGNYKKDELHGKFVKYGTGADPHVEEYKNGKLIQKKSGKKVFFFLKKKEKVEKKTKTKGAKDIAVEENKDDLKATPVKAEKAVKEDKPVVEKKVKVKKNKKE